MHYTNVGLTVDNGYINLLELMRKDVANRFSAISYLLYVTRWNFMALQCLLEHLYGFGCFIMIRNFCMTIGSSPCDQLTLEVPETN